MNGACVLRKLMIVASIQHVSSSVRIQLPQSTLFHAIVVGAQVTTIKSLTLDYNCTKRAIPFSMQRPGEYLINYVIPYYDQTPRLECTLQIDLDNAEFNANSAPEDNYLLVYGIKFTDNNMAPLGKFLPELISLLYWYDVEADRSPYKLEHSLAFTLYVTGYAAIYARQFFKAAFYFERLALMANTMTVRQQPGRDPEPSVLRIRLIISFAVTRLVAVVELDQNEKKYDAILNLYKTMQLFFTMLLQVCSCTEAHVRLFDNYYATLVKQFPDSVSTRSQHNVALEACLCNCLYDLLLLLLLDSADSVDIPQLSEFLSKYSPNSVTEVCSFHINYKKYIRFSRSACIFDTKEKTSAIIYLLDLILQFNLTSLQPEVLVLVISPFILQLTATSFESYPLSGQICTALKAYQSKLSCLSSTSLFRFFVDLLSVLDIASLFEALETEGGQLLYSILITVLDLLKTARFVIDLQNVSFSQHLPVSEGTEVTKLYWDLERYVKSFSYLCETGVLITRQIRHKYIYLHTLSRKFNKLVGGDNDAANEAQRQAAACTFRERYQLKSKTMDDMFTFLTGSLHPFRSELDLAIKLNILLGTVFGTILLRCKEHGVIPSNELLISLNSYLYKCSACIGLVLCNLDDLPIRGIPIQEQQLYSKTCGKANVADISVQSPLIIDFKLSELVESKMLVYKPLSTDIFKHPSLSNAILHTLGNFFAGFGFCVSTFIPSSFTRSVAPTDKEREKRRHQRSPGHRQDFQHRVYGSVAFRPTDTSHKYQADSEYGRPLSQIYLNDRDVDATTSDSMSSEQASSNAYLALISYYYTEAGAPFPFLKPVTILLNTLFASGIVLGNRVAHKNKEERVYHCSLSVSDLGLERLTSNELYTLSENIWYFIRYYSNSLIQCNAYSDLLFGAYLMEVLRFSRTNSLNEVLLCQLLNYGRLYNADSLISMDLPLLKVLESCFPAYILLDLPSVREAASATKVTKLSVSKVLGWLQTIGFCTSRFYILTELIYVVTNQILQHTKYQMFSEYYGVLDQLMCMFGSLLDRLHDVDSTTVEAYTYTKHYIEVLRLLTSKVCIQLSTRFIPFSYLYNQALRDATSLLISMKSLKYYNDLLVMQLAGHSATTVQDSTDSYISKPFLIYTLRSALIHNMVEDTHELQAVNLQILKLVMLSWGCIKRSALFNRSSICEFAQISAIFTIFDVVILPSCEDEALSSAKFSFFSDLQEYASIPLFLFVYTKTLAGAYALFDQALAHRTSGPKFVISEGKCARFLEFYIPAIKSTACTRTQIYASSFLRKFIAITQAHTFLQHRMRQQMRQVYRLTEVVTQEWGDLAIDFEEQEPAALVAELETPLNQNMEAVPSIDQDVTPVELCSIPDLKSLSDVSIIPLISNNVLQEMQPRHISQTELPHYSSVESLKQVVTTQFAIVFSFVVPFVGAREANIPSEFQQDGGLSSQQESFEKQMDRMDGIVDTPSAKCLRLPMGYDMPTYAVQTPGGTIERRYNVIHCKGLVEVAARQSSTEADKKAVESAAPPVPTKIPVPKTNELARRYMNKEERERRAQYLLKHAMEEFADGDQAADQVLPLQDLGEEKVGAPAESIDTVLPGNLMVPPTDSSEHDTRESNQSTSVAADLIGQEKKASVSESRDNMPEQRAFEFSDDDGDECVEFNVTDEMIEGQLPDSIVKVLRLSQRRQ